MRLRVNVLVPNSAIGMIKDAHNRCEKGCDCEAVDLRRIARQCGGRRFSIREAVLSLLLLAGAIAVSGCVRTPRGVADQYLTSLQQFNYGKCYEMLSEQDRHARTIKQFLAEIPLAPAVTPELFRAILANTRYELGEQHRGTDRAWVPVTITTVNLPVWERTLDAQAGPDGSGEDLAMGSLESGDFPKLTYVDQIVLVKQFHHWVVYADFATRDRLSELHHEALEQYHQHQYDRAIATYRYMLGELDKHEATGSLGLKASYARELQLIEAVKEQMPQAAAYAPKLKLSQVAMKMSEEHLPAIFGRITNSGTKAVDEVQLAVKWYARKDGHQQLVYTENHPVVATPIEFTDFAEQVLPFMPGQSRDFGFLLAAPAQIQQDAEPYVSVSSLAFTQSSAPLPKRPPQAKTSAKTKTSAQPDLQPQATPASPGKPESPAAHAKNANSSAAGAQATVPGS